MITTSNDISNLDFAALIDLAQVNPVISIINMSSGAGIANCKFIFKLVSPGGLVIYEGDFNSPDKTGTWSSFDFPVTLPQIGGHVEWGGNGYQITVSVQDSDQMIFTLTKSRELCRPNGNEPGTKNNFGAMLLSMDVQCDKAKLYVEDVSNYLYGGQPGTETTKKLKLVYPSSDPDTTTAPFERTSAFGNVMIPLYVNGAGHQLLGEDIREYEDAQQVTVRVKYRFKETFAVLCHIDLCGVIAAVRKFEESVSAGGCTADDLDTLSRVNAKLNIVLIARSQPNCGVNIPEVIAEIETLLGTDFSCSCAYGVNEITPIADGTAAVDCEDIKDCINAEFNKLDPKCVMDDANWQIAGLQLKMQNLLNYLCNNSNVRVGFTVGQDVYSYNGQLFPTGSPGKNIAGQTTVIIPQLLPGSDGRVKGVLVFQRGSGTETPLISYNYNATTATFTLLNGAAFNDGEQVYIVGV